MMFTQRTALENRKDVSLGKNLECLLSRIRKIMSFSESGSLTAPYKRHVFLKSIFFGIMQPTVLFKAHLVFLMSHCGNWGRLQAQKKC